MSYVRSTFAHLYNACEGSTIELIGWCVSDIEKTFKTALAAEIVQLYMK